MKKIMFNDRFGLTQAVLDGRKTMTRRVITNKVAIELIEQGYPAMVSCTGSPYKVGEVVAVVQSYKDVFAERHDKRVQLKSAGWTNKMFTKAELMPHQTRITNIRVERLQDISDEDCLREGIMPYKDTCEYYYTSFNAKQDIDYRNIFPKGAFASLIDKVIGKGTWERNPWVYVYEFKLVD